MNNNTHSQFGQTEPTGYQAPPVFTGYQAPPVFTSRQAPPVLIGRQAPPVPPAAHFAAPVPLLSASTPHQEYFVHPQHTLSQKEKMSMENWFGRNVIGIIASVLVFLGMLFLGFLVVPSLSDAIKIILMFVFSGLLIAGGTALTVVRKNNFTTALLGCGCGSLFISIMLTHAFFHAIPDIAAFALLLFWLAGSLALVKISDSLLMSIISHVGMVISLCLCDRHE